MSLEINKFYKLVILFKDTELTYTAKIVSIDNNFITFIDRNGTTLHYNINSVITYRDTAPFIIPELKKEELD